MTLVDSSVWMDFFNGRNTPEVDKLDGLLGTAPLAIGDLMLTEVLQGFRSDADYKVARVTLTELMVLNIVNTDIAIKSADNFRQLRKRGITVRKTIDILIATYCIENQHVLLHSDKDFLPCVTHLGLRVYS